jgi:pimeloyl-ACP methyl ester carboxylesterase
MGGRAYCYSSEAGLSEIADETPALHGKRVLSLLLKPAEEIAVRSSPKLGYAGEAMIDISGRAVPMRLLERRPHRTGFRATGLIVLGLLALAACLAPRSDAAVRVPDLSWAPCPDQSGFECATAAVPRNYRNRDGATIRLAVIRHPAADPSRRVGTLFLNPGGPGAAKALLPLVFDVFPDSLQERFDVITWDPRGFGESTSVQCFASQEDEHRFLAGVGQAGDTFPVGPAKRARWIKRYASFGRHCDRRDGGLLRHMSTAESAKDLNLLRRAVGSSELNYYGNSYGTLLGATYANMFPGRVRTMVLGSITNPVAWVAGRRGASDGPASFLPTFLRQRSDEGSRKTLDAFLDLCGRTSTAQCAFSAGSPRSTRAKFAELLARLRDAPSGTKPSYATLVSTVTAGLYGVGDWGRIAELLQSVWEGRSASGESVLRTVPVPVPPAGPAPAARSAAGADYGSFGQFLGVVCGESPNPGPAAFPGIDAFASARSGPIAGGWTWLAEPCATWPATAAARYAGRWDRRTANPIMVIGNTHDPATPYQNAVAISRQLARARLLTVDGYGHGTFDQSCTFPYLTSYLIDETLPPRGTRCRGLQPFG